MSEINALGKLRTAARNMAKGRNLENHEECNLFLIIADEIEAEIAERFMELPVDADGVRVEIGDRLHEHENGYEFTVDGLKIWGNDREWWAYQENGIQAPVYRCTNIKSRTIEDVLRDVWKEAIDYAKSDMWRNPDEAFAERADEIRELMGVDE